MSKNISQTVWHKNIHYLIVASNGENLVIDWKRGTSVIIHFGFPLHLILFMITEGNSNVVATNFKRKGPAHYIFACVFCQAEGEHLWNKDIFQFESSFCSWDNQVLTFQKFKCHDVMKYPSMKHETHFTEKLGKQTQPVNEMWHVYVKLHTKKLFIIKLSEKCGLPLFNFSQNPLQKGIWRGLYADFNKFW